MQTRNLSIDLIKIIAMFAVIGLHTFKASESWRFANIFYETFVIAVPLFFMASGYVLFGRTDNTTKYAITKIINIVRLVFVLAVIVWLFKVLVGQEFKVNRLIKLFGGAFLQKGDLWVCWYLGAMAILYMLFPFVNRLYCYKRNQFNSLLVCLFMIEFFVFTGNVDNSGECWEAKILQPFRVWNWLFYFMWGGYFKGRKNHFGGKGFFVWLFMAFVANILFQERYKDAINSPYCEYFYSSLNVILLCTLIFYMILSINISHSRFIIQMSRLFLPVYIIHPFVIRLVNKTNLHALIPNSCIPFVDFCFVAIVSIIFSHYFMKMEISHKIMKI